MPMERELRSPLPFQHVAHVGAVGDLEVAGARGMRALLEQREAAIVMTTCIGGEIAWTLLQ